MLSWYKGVIGTNFVPQISTMVLIICTMVQNLNLVPKTHRLARGKGSKSKLLSTDAARGAAAGRRKR